MKILTELGIESINAGACSGANYWSETKDGANVIKSINPTDASLIASVIPATEADYTHIVAAAKNRFKTLREVPAPLRGELVRQMGEALRENKDALGSLVSLEMGKSKQEGDGEVQEMIDMADFAVGQSRMLYGNSMHSERPNHRMYEQWQPLGVIGIITAFNFPVAVWAWNAFIAAICGNTCIWKPSSKTPLCAIAIQNICNTVMSQNGYEGIFNLLITNNRDISSKLLDDSTFPLISFTGSSHVGQAVSERVAKRFGRSLLELSGNNAIIVDETAKLELAVQATFFSAIGTAGQRCTSTRRLILHEGIYDTFLKQLLDAYQQIKIGDPLDTNVQMGPLIDESAVAQFEGAVSEAKAAGGKLLIGGKRLEINGCFVEPTIIEADNDWPIVQAETFAPILYVMKCQNLTEAIGIQNRVCQGLSSALFSESMKACEQFLSSAGSDCGIANINQGTSGAEIGGAFGGEKATGGGREAGSDAWKAYMRRQTVTVNWGDTLPLAQGIDFSNANK